MHKKEEKKKSVLLTRQKWMYCPILL